jgi:hypothetical protein
METESVLFVLLVNKQLAAWFSFAIEDILDVSKSIVVFNSN